MAVDIFDLRMYGSATMPDSDATTAIGGAISLSKQVSFVDVNGLVQAVSSNSGDTTQTVTISYLSSVGTVLTEAQTLTGLTPVTFAATMVQLLKGIKSATCAGDVAVEFQTAERSNTAQAGAPSTITLDTGASAVDDFYNGMLIRLTGGTGSGQLARILDYVGSTKVATVSKAWGTQPDNTSTFRIAKGFYFEKAPSEITEVRRIFYNASADAPGGSTKHYYEKVFYKNTDGSGTLAAATVKEAADPAALVTFGLATSKDDTGGNGGGNNRQVAPGGITFASTDVAVPTGVLAAGEAIGVWLHLTLLAGAVGANNVETLALEGTTV